MIKKPKGVVRRAVIVKKLAEKTKLKDKKNYYKNKLNKIKK